LREAAIGFVSGGSVTAKLYCHRPGPLHAAARAVLLLRRVPLFGNLLVPIAFAWVAAWPLLLLADGVLSLTLGLVLQGVWWSLPFGATAVHRQAERSDPPWRIIAGGKLTVAITRDSVAMGDDVESHDRFVQANRNSTLGEVVVDILGAGYLPGIVGGKATWRIHLGRDGEPVGVAAQQWQAPRFCGDPARPIAVLPHRVHFEYLTQQDPGAAFDAIAK
jgi:hypothetical protein